MMARGASVVPGALVVPMLIGKSGVEYRTTSLYAAEQCMSARPRR